MRKALLFLAITAITFTSCSKSNDDDNNPGNNGAGTINGFWKGSTNTYGVGAVIRSNGTARGLIYTGGLTMPADTSNSNVYKSEGTYTVSGNTITVNCANTVLPFTLKFTGTLNSEFTSMTGTSVFSSSLIVTQSFSMVK